MFLIIQIRAANLTSCNIMEALANDAAFYKFKGTHKVILFIFPKKIKSVCSYCVHLLKECVRRKAALSLQTVRNITELEV